MALVLGVFVVALAAEAQAKRPYRIGVLHTGFLLNTPHVEGLKAGLQALDLEEGRDVMCEYGARAMGPMHPISIDRQPLMSLAS